MKGLGATKAPPRTAHQRLPDAQRPLPPFPVRPSKCRRRTAYMYREILYPGWSWIMMGPRTNLASARALELPMTTPRMPRARCSFPYQPSARKNMVMALVKAGPKAGPTTDPSPYNMARALGMSQPTSQVTSQLKSRPQPKGYVLRPGVKHPEKAQFPCRHLLSC